MPNRNGIASVDGTNRVAITAASRRQRALRHMSAPCILFGLRVRSSIMRAECIFPLNGCGPIVEEGPSRRLHNLMYPPTDWGRSHGHSHPIRPTGERTTPLRPESSGSALGTSLMVAVL